VTARVRVVVVIAVVSAAWPVAAAAQPSEHISSYDVAIAIDPSGTMDVTETIAYDFGANERHGVFRDVPDRLQYDRSYDRVFPVDVESVTGSPGTPTEYTTEDEGGTLRIRIGDPDRTITGLHTYTIRYRVDGAMNGFVDHDELYWNAIGDEWPVPIDRARVSVRAPGRIERVACFAGLSGSSGGCGSASSSGPSATFAATGLAPYQAMTIVVGLPKGVVEPPSPILRERWSLARAFSFTPGTAGLTVFLLVLAVAYFVMLAWRTGRDRRWAAGPVDIVMGAPVGTPEQAVPLFESGGAPVEFAPPEGLRPGQVGTLLDEVANPLDVTATVVDLAVRKHLVIEEIPKHGWFGKPDWRLRLLPPPPNDELVPYERRLLDGLFEDGDEALLSALKTKFVTRLHRVQDALYDDAVGRGWFLARPDRIRQRWAAIGVGVLVLGGVLEYAAIRWTHVALLPIPLLVLGLLIVFSSHAMPRRTPRGTGLVRRVHGFRTVIATAETHPSRWAEQENVFTRYLPYAVVFGLTEKWAKAFEGLEQAPDTSWYVSTHPFAFASFGQAVDGFSTVAAGTIASTPGGSGGSGFGGGGAGGGGGGGGGGSW
jgi:hypothetical protein